VSPADRRWHEVIIDTRCQCGAPAARQDGDDRDRPGASGRREDGVQLRGPVAASARARASARGRRGRPSRGPSTRAGLQEGSVVGRVQDGELLARRRRRRGNRACARRRSGGSAPAAAPDRRPRAEVAGFLGRPRGYALVACARCNASTPPNRNRPRGGGGLGISVEAKNRGRPASQARSRRRFPAPRNDASPRASRLSGQAIGKAG